MDEKNDIDQQAKLILAVSQLTGLFGILRKHKLCRRLAARAIAIAFAEAYGEGSPRIEVVHGNRKKATLH